MSFLMPKAPAPPKPAPPAPERSDADIQAAAASQRNRYASMGSGTQMLAGASTGTGVQGGTAARLLGQVGTV